MIIFGYKHEKTPEYSEKRAEKSKCPDNVRFARKREISKQSNDLGSHVHSWFIKIIISSIETRDSQFRHLYKRMLRETIASFHP